MDERNVRREAEDLAGHLATLKALCGDDEQLILDTVEGETDLEGFVTRLVEMIAADEADCKGIGEFMDKLKARKERIGERAKRLRTLLATVLCEMPGGRLSTPIATVRVTKLKPDLIIQEEADIPSKWWKMAEPKLDRAALRKYLNTRAEALAAVKPEDRAAVAASWPEVPGVSLDNGDISVTIAVR